MKVKLKAGDILHYGPHDATGILISSFVRSGMTFWKYILRSPIVHDRTHHLVNEFEVEAVRITESIERGDLEHYARSKEGERSEC